MSPVDPQTLTVLLVEDNPHDAEFLQRVLDDSGVNDVRIERADRLSAACSRIAKGGIDEVLLDLKLPDSVGLETLGKIQEAAPELPIIILTGIQDEQLGTLAVRQGAQDYIVKGQFDGSGLHQAMRYAWERKQAESALRESQERYHRLVEAAVEGILVVEEDAAKDGNPAFSRMFGYAPSDIAHLPFLSFFSPASRDVVARRAREDSPARFEALGLRKDGSEFPIEVIHRIVQTEGRTQQVLVLHDLSERKQASEARLAMVEQSRELDQLRQLDKFRTGFINMAAHELNTPMTPIKIELHLLERSLAGRLKGREADSLGIVKRNFDRLGRLVNDILDSARIQSQRLKLHRQPLDLTRCISDALDTFREAAAAQGVQLDSKVIFNNAVPGDAGRITQVLLNLLNNALKFTPRGGSIRVETERTAKEAIVRVTDTGIGLEQEQIAKLFQPFTQVHDLAPHKAPGSGLGLYISRSIIELHQGRIWCESPGKGKGTTFGFALPLEGEASSEVFKNQKPLAAPEHAEA